MANSSRLFSDGTVLNVNRMMISSVFLRLPEDSLKLDFVLIFLEMYFRKSMNEALIPSV